MNDDNSSSDDEKHLSYRAIEKKFQSQTDWPCHERCEVYFATIVAVTRMINYSNLEGILWRLSPRRQK